jgi:hypothetical protein
MKEPANIVIKWLTYGQSNNLNQHFDLDIYKVSCFAWSSNKYSNQIPPKFAYVARLK